MLRRSKSTEAFTGRKWRLSHTLFVVGAAYVLIIGFKFFNIMEFTGLVRSNRNISRTLIVTNYTDSLNSHQHRRDAPSKPSSHDGRITEAIVQSEGKLGGNLTDIERTADEAWDLGMKAWEDVKNYKENVELNPAALLRSEKEPCPLSVSKNESELGIEESLMYLPCGLQAGSSITVIGTPRSAHPENLSHLTRLKQEEETVMVSQFIVELRGLKAVDGEEPPKILHFNARLKGDWSHRPVIELNTCYRMQWGKAMRCDGTPSKEDDDTVDGVIKCEKWLSSDMTDSKESKSASWLKIFIGGAKKPEMAGPYPFAEDRLFVLTVRSSVEGFHIYVGGQHVTSFTYRPGFTIEDATGLAISGNVGIHSVFATSLPKSHPSISHNEVLELSESWKSSPLPSYPIDLFIGIISTTNHFAERMAIRKTWMQYSAIKLSNVVARFFVALSPRKEMNVILKKEAEYFGDIIILPFMDRYELVVLKTVAICEFGMNNLTAAYIMKCDDDTFVRVDVVLREMNNAAAHTSLYMGNLNFLHKPLRNGKWAVTYEEWQEEVYPPYANGPGYVISSDIAKFIVSNKVNHTLKIFKMEDVSMGMWVEEFNASTPVRYTHSWKFCQYGCMDGYYTSHYQSPRQMLCLWDKLARGRAHCCNFR